MGGPRDLVVRPRSFFRRLGESPSLAGPAAIAALLALSIVVRLFSFLYALGDLMDQLEAESTELVYAIGGLAVSAPRELTFAAVLVAAWFFVGWALVAGTIHLASRYLGGEGSFRRLVALVGWGLFPALIPMLVATAHVVVTALSAPDVATAAAAETWLRSAFRESAFRTAVEYASPLFALWSAYLWYLAARIGRDLTRRRALIAVALPAGLLVLNEAGAYIALVA